MVEVAENGTGDNDHLKDIGEGVAADGGAENPSQKVLRLSQHHKLEYGSQDMNPEENVQSLQPVGNIPTGKEEHAAEEEHKEAQVIPQPPGIIENGLSGKEETKNAVQEKGEK